MAKGGANETEPISYAINAYSALQQHKILTRSVVFLQLLLGMWRKKNVMCVMRERCVREEAADDELHHQRSCGVE